jgi:hypothetical protein
VLAAAVAVALPLSVAADAFAQSPGADQYVPSLPSAGGNKDPRKQKSTPSTPQSGTSTDDQAIDQIANDQSLGAPSDAQKAKAKAKAKARAKARAAKREAARRKAKRQAAADKANATAVVVTKDDGDGGDDGALASVGNALTDWDDPVLPCLVVLVALLTLAASVNVLLRRRRESRS